MCRMTNDATDIKYLIHRGTKQTVNIVLQSDIDIVAALNTWSLQWLLLGNKHLNIEDIIDLGVTIDANLLNPRSTQSALVTEVCRKNVRTVEYLLEHGTNVNYSTDRWNPAIIYASRYRHSALFENAELLLIYGADIQIICNTGIHLVYDVLLSAKKELRNLFVAHLAMLAATDESSLTEATRKGIDGNVLDKNHFDACSKQLEGLKAIALCEFVTLFDLLHAKEQTLIRYARNKELRKACENRIEIKISDLESYYINRLQKRISRAFRRVNSEEKIAHVVEALTGFGIDRYHGVVYKIISYLGIQDFKNLGIIAHESLCSNNPASV